jgi:hypothetical protein
MKTANKNRQTTIAPINPEMTTPRVTSIPMETPKATKDTPAVRQAWVRLYDAIIGKRRVNRQRTLAHQH